MAGDLEKLKLVYYLQLETTSNLVVSWNNVVYRLWHDFNSIICYGSIASFVSQIMKLEQRIVKTIKMI